MSDFAPSSCRVYTRNGCGYCDAAVNRLELKQIPHDVLNRDDGDFTQDWFTEEYGVFATYPQVVMWSKSIGGYTDLCRYIEECVD